MRPYLAANAITIANSGFNFLLDRGSSQPLAVSSQQSLKAENRELKADSLTNEAKKLIHYFFLGLTLPSEAFWVNLKPQEPERITSAELAKTDLGRTLLEQDLKLKKDVARYLHPQNPQGKQYWERLYAALGKDKAEKATITSSNRVWVVPAEAVVLETEDGALLAKATLKVLLESEYLSLTEKQSNKDIEAKPEVRDEIKNISQALMKEIILPAITQDINTSPAYAPLRQIYHSLILAEWFKRRVQGSGNKGQKKNEPLNPEPYVQNPFVPYINSGTTEGLESTLPWAKQAIWQEYLKSYTDGEYKLQDTLFGLKRMYWSGGVMFNLGGTGASSPITIIPKDTPGALETVKEYLHLPVSEVWRRLIGVLTRKGGKEASPLSSEITTIGATQESKKPEEEFFKLSNVLREEKINTLGHTLEQGNPLARALAAQALKNLFNSSRVRTEDKTPIIEVLGIAVHHGNHAAREAIESFFPQLEKDYPYAGTNYQDAILKFLGTDAAYGNPLAIQTFKNIFNYSQTTKKENILYDLDTLVDKGVPVQKAIELLFPQLEKDFASASPDYRIAIYTTLGIVVNRYDSPLAAQTLKNFFNSSRATGKDKTVITKLLRDAAISGSQAAVRALENLILQLKESLKAVNPAFSPNTVQSILQCISKKSVYSDLFPDLTASILENAINLTFFPRQESSPDAIKAIEQFYSLYDYLEKSGINLYRAGNVLNYYFTIEDNIKTTLAGFLLSERNEKLLNEKTLLVNYLQKINASKSIFELLENYVQHIKRENKLAFYRELNGILLNRVMIASDTIEDWHIFLNDYVERFDFLADRNLLLAHRYLYQGVPLNDDRLTSYGLSELGIHATGTEGLKQIENLVKHTMRKVAAERKIDEGNLDNPVMRGIIGGLTGFSTAQWGHGSWLGIELKEFVGEFNELEREGKIPALDPAFNQEEEFRVRRLGTLKLTQDAQNKFEEYRQVIKEALSLSEEPTENLIARLKERALTILESKQKELEDKLNTAEGTVKKDIETQMNNVRNTMEKLNHPQLTTLLNLAITMAEQKELRDIAVLLLIVETVSNPEYALFRRDLSEVVNSEMSTSSLQRIIELKNVFIKEHTLNDLDKNTKKTLLNAFNVRIFEKELSHIKILEDDQIKVGVFTTKGILGEMAPDIGDACYSAERNIMARVNPSPITAIIFTTGEDLDTKFIGSMLILENTIGGRPVFILRAVNPSDAFLSEYSAEDFLKETIKYVEKIAEKKGIKLIVAPMGDYGALSNRSSINSAFAKFVKPGFCDRNEAPRRQIRVQIWQKKVRAYF